MYPYHPTLWNPFLTTVYVPKRVSAFSFETKQKSLDHTGFAIVFRRNIRLRVALKCGMCNTTVCDATALERTNFS